MTKRRVDAVVVGGGSAAFAAAVAAKQCGAGRVVVLEKASPEQSGGNAVFSTTGFRVAYGDKQNLRPVLDEMSDEDFDALAIGPYSIDDFVRSLKLTSHGRLDIALATTLAKDSYEAVRWMKDTGIRWEPWHHYILVEGKKVFPPGAVIHPVGGGRGQVERWREIAQSLRIEVHYRSQVTELLGSQWMIEGVVADVDGTVTAFESDRVFLCAGGFQANAAKRAAYLGSAADQMKVRGSRHDTGEVLEMALVLGAQSAGHWEGAHATPIDLLAPNYESGSKANRYDYTYGVVVNRLGKRFFDEGEADHAYTYAKTGWAVNQEPGSVAFEIFDSVGYGLLRPMYRTHGRPYFAETLGELAEMMGVDPGTFEEEIIRFNKAIDTSRPYQPALEDGRGTVGIDPPKSNWAATIEQPLFYAYPITAGITFTFGGLAVDTDARVINRAGEPVEGLYAVGDIMGLFSFNYPSGSGQTRNAVFGRRAARHAFGA